MKTRFYRNHYGYNAETVDGSTVFHTMKVYSGDIVTSINDIQSENGTMRISAPRRAGSSLAHPPVKRLSFKLLQEIHAKHVLTLTA